MSSLVFVDCEAAGPCPSLGVMTEFAAVTRRGGRIATYHGVLLSVPGRLDNPAIPDVDLATLDRVSYSERARLVFTEFDGWLTFATKGRPIFISDNPAYDWQWINDGFWRALDRNPFGYSARRIGDFYAGLCGDVSKTNEWKRMRHAPHDHNPINDALGNLQAFERMLAGDR